MCHTDGLVTVTKAVTEIGPYVTPFSVPANVTGLEIANKLVRIIPPANEVPPAVPQL
jgi:hypothetical protein